MLAPDVERQPGVTSLGIAAEEGLPEVRIRRRGMVKEDLLDLPFHFRSEIVRHAREELRRIRDTERRPTQRDPENHPPAPRVPTPLKVRGLLREVAVREHSANRGPAVHEGAKSEHRAAEIPLRHSGVVKPVREEAAFAR